MDGEKKNILNNKIKSILERTNIEIENYMY